LREPGRSPVGMVLSIGLWMFTAVLLAMRAGHDAGE
jgi:hypothetical protein